MDGSNQLFHQKFEALAIIGLVAMVLVIIASQGSVALVQTCSYRWGPFEVGEVPDDGQETVIGDVESSELGGGGGGGDLSSSRIARRGASGLCLGYSSVRTGP